MSYQIQEVPRKYNQVFRKRFHWYVFLQADLIDMPFSNCLFKIEVKDTDKYDLFQIILIILALSRLVANNPRSIGHTPFFEIDMLSYTEISLLSPYLPYSFL